MRLLVTQTSLKKAHISAYQRTDPKTGSAVPVKEHEDKRPAAQIHPAVARQWSSKESIQQLRESLLVLGRDLGFEPGDATQKPTVLKQEGAPPTQAAKKPDAAPQKTVLMRPPAATAAAVHLLNEGGRMTAVLKNYRALPQVEKELIDHWLVATQHPLASQTGTPEDRFTAWLTTRAEAMKQKEAERKQTVQQEKYEPDTRAPVEKFPEATQEVSQVETVQQEAVEQQEEVQAQQEPFAAQLDKQADGTKFIIPVASTGSKMVGTWEKVTVGGEHFWKKGSVYRPSKDFATFHESITRQLAEPQKAKTGKTMADKRVVLARKRQARVQRPGTSELKPRQSEGLFASLGRRLRGLFVKRWLYKATRSYAIVMANLPVALTQQVQQMASRIQDNDLAEKGRVTDSHITVLFGLHGDNAQEVQQLLKRDAPLHIRLGKTSLFPPSAGSEGAEVVKIDVESPDLHWLHEKIATALPHTNTHPDYHPHITLAYVKPGAGEKYVGMTDLEGQTALLDSLVFSDTQKQETPIQLGASSLRRGLYLARDLMKARVRSYTRRGKKGQMVTVADYNREEGTHYPGQHHIERQRGLDPEQRKAEAHAAWQVDHAHEELIAEYHNKFGHTKTVDADKAKSLFQEFHDDPQKHAASLHEPSSTLAKLTYDDLLKKQPEGGVVRFTAGGGGSGKGTAFKQVYRLQDGEIIYDATLSNADSAQKQIDKALAYGQRVVVHYIHRPAYLAARGALDRALNSPDPLDRRVVSSHEIARAHYGAQNTIFALAEHYKDNPKVYIQVIDNSGRIEEVRLSSLDELQRNRYANYEEVQDHVTQGFQAYRQEHEAAGKTLPDHVKWIAFGETDSGADDGRDSQSGSADDHRKPEKSRKSSNLSSTHTCQRRVAAGLYLLTKARRVSAYDRVDPHTGQHVHVMEHTDVRPSAQLHLFRDRLTLQQHPLVTLTQRPPLVLRQDRKTAA